MMVILVVVALPISAEFHIRYNQAGFRPDRPKSLVLISTSDLAGTSWSIEHQSSVVKKGTVSASVTGKGDHTSHSYNHVVDFSDLTTPGHYTFKTGGQEVSLRIATDPYSVLITDALRHLKTVRSGSPEALNHQLSHAGDSAAIVYIPSGNITNGAWVKDESAKTVDCRGGWYDAGDYIKFTLTIANTVYYLLEAWEANPKVFTKVLSSSELPDLLDEAYHGLNYLMKVYPSPDCFVIQVGNHLDHDQPLRLPEDDVLDGKRPALCAISPVHMGLTAAALAKGASVFRVIGRENDSERFISKALSIYERALKPDALTTAAFERDETNDFYHDNTLKDNMALGAVELFKTTNDSSWLTKALSYGVTEGNWIGWTTYNWSVNNALGKYDSASILKAKKELDHFIGNMDPLWGTPLDYTWGSLLGWCGAGAAAGETFRTNGDNRCRELHLKMVDYLFGRNNWGYSFLASTRLDNTIRHIYNTIYQLTDKFPQGAVALGPADRKNHDAMRQYFGTPPVSVSNSFQTSKAVYYDWNKDFVTSETVTMSQSYAIWLLALASDTLNHALPDSSVPVFRENDIEIDSIVKLPIDDFDWYLYSDNADGGNSIARWNDTTFRSVYLEPREGAVDLYAGFCITLPTKYQNMSGYDGVIIHGLFETGANVRVDICMKSVTDYDYHGKSIIGNGTEPKTLFFKDISQQGFGKNMAFSSTKIPQINFNYFSTVKPTTIRIDSIQLIRFKNHSSKTAKPFITIRNHNIQWKRINRQFIWNGAEPAVFRIQDMLGRQLWRKMLKPGEAVILPKFPGYQILTGPGGMVVDRWIDHNL